MGDAVDDRISGIVWSWLLYGTHRLGAILAVSGERDVVGFAHYRPFPRTLHGNEACYLDDLYVAPAFRRLGIAEALVHQVRRIAGEQGWSEVRWVTTPENYGARRLYERLATRSDLITFRTRLPRA